MGAGEDSPPNWPVNHRSGSLRWEKLAQNGGWLVMGVIVLVGLLGGWGGGPLSDATARDVGSGLAIEYDRFSRATGQNDLRLRVPVPNGAETVAVLVSASYLSDNQVESLDPEPSEVTASEGSVRFDFLVGEGAEVGVTFDLAPQGAGARSGWVSVPGGDRVEFWQFVYP
ncbi:hypothetical protein [Actinoalloteichus caeruleus]|uniref:DUF4352 family protein n=1 Tax=Actinoalloteichus caeruleus DSM 43889 TaxID=1120930 RepID=A0ABT1JRJ8_ACTCY|nr:hypothetical protein [Actinoalloteichus caeruleus]MCP2334286.1 hypothetical protein [Actinoalloteichus caeruleus DSM 43889]